MDKYVHQHKIDVITHQAPIQRQISYAAIQDREWMNNYISYKIVDVIT